MGMRITIDKIVVERNDLLALRAFGTKGCTAEECVPEKMEVGATYNFKKNSPRRIFPDEEIHLVTPSGGGKISSPIAHVKILEYTYHIHDRYTSGKYKVTRLV